MKIRKIKNELNKRYRIKFAIIKRIKLFEQHYNFMGYEYENLISSVGYYTSNTTVEKVKKKKILIRYNLIDGKYVGEIR